MESKPVAQVPADPVVTKTHSQPQFGNGNPYSEAQFKNLKYWSEFPDRFGVIQDSRAFCYPFFNGHTRNHHHLGTASMTPEQVHYG